MTTLPKHGLGTIRRKSIDLPSFTPIKERTFADSQSLPLVMEPSADEVDLADWLVNNTDHIANQISKHGGILFRGFGLATPAEFERVASSISKELFAEYGDLPREDANARVYASTPYPEDKSILYHNESSHLSSWPSRINFFCMTVAQQGGATPIVDCRKVYHDLDPSVRDDFENKGLLYIRNFCEGLDVSWQRFFGTEDRAAVESTCNQTGMSCEWVGANNLRVKQFCRAVLRHPSTREMCFFNQVQLHHAHCLDPDVRASLLALFKPEDLPRDVRFGDGSQIDDSVMDHVGEIYERNAVRFQWQKGDLVSLDNMLVAHGRDPYVGPRRILVALGDMVHDGEMSQ